ncbi:TonB-dependent receptor [Fusobacterium varium]|uniref:TonB-dependent receptor n=1 Tax=Fusobacterium varium TaxID=856 RepID=UPI000E4F8A26|nr:TonB-dependent receptor [Fusobacterium varium]RHG38256.1 TonB-dependent receptor [Fusobacterium varium]
MYKKIGILALFLSSSLYANEVEKKEEFAVKLNESTITSERYEETPVIETAKNVTVITNKEIEKRGYKNIEEALVNVPGLSFSGGNLSMRGQVPSMGNKHLVVLVDGIPQNGIDNRSFDLDFIPVEQIEKIEVVPAGGAIMYGGNATSGVINIITKNYENRKYWGNAGLQLGSFNERKYKFNYGVNLTENFSLDAKYINTDKDGYRNYTKKESEFGEIGVKYKLKDGNVGFKYIRNERKSNGSAYLTKVQYDEDRRQNNPDYKEKTAHDTQDKYILEFNKKLSNKLSFSAVTEYREREYTYSQPKTDKYSSYHSRIKNTDSIYTNAQLKYNYKEKSNLIFGGDYSKAKVKEKGYGVSKNIIYQKSYTETDYEAIAGYILNKYSYNNFIFTQGIRLERNKFDEDETTYEANKTFKSKKNISDSNTNTNYELAVNYMFSEDTSGYISWNRVYRSPNLTEYTGWKIDKGTGVTASRDSQEVDTFEIGIKSLINNIYLSGALFYIKGNREIMYDSYRDEIIDKSESGSYYNLDGKTERIGIEFASEQYFDKLTLRENFTYMHNEIVDGPYKGNDIPGVSNVIFGLGATYEITSQFTFNIESNYHGKAYLINDYYNKVPKASSYMVTNISAKYNFENGIALSAGIDNIFNEIYCDYITYAGKKINYSPSPERTYYVSAEYKF